MDNKWGTYAIITTLLCFPYAHAILVGWVSKNSNNVGTRTVSAAVYNSKSTIVQGSLTENPVSHGTVSVQLGSVIGNNIYREDDKPKYRRGNSVLLALNILGIVVFIGTKVYYVSRNRYRDRIWAAMTEEVSLELTLSSKSYIKETLTVFPAATARLFEEYY